MAVVSHLEFYLRAMEDVGASTIQFDTFCAMVRAGDPVEVGRGCDRQRDWADPPGRAG